MSLLDSKTYTFSHCTLLILENGKDLDSGKR